MILVLLTGALVGLGLLLFVLRYDTGTGTAAAELARLDAARERGRRTAQLEATHDDDRAETIRARRIGSLLRVVLEARGWRVPPGIRADLAVMGQTLESFLGTVVLSAIAGFFAPFIALLPAGLLLGWNLTVPLWLSLAGILLGAFVGVRTLQDKAKARREDFRHVVSAFLDLVAMNLAGGRGVPEALASAAGLSDGWAMVRIRDTMETARLQGITPWAALGDLGDDMAIEELRDLAATLALVAEDGAKVRDSLSARAISMRQRELADAEARAEQRSQSMLVAQLLLCAGFLIFLIYPAIAEIAGL